MQKQLQRDKLVSRTIALEQIHDAFTWLLQGKVARSVMVCNSPVPWPRRHAGACRSARGTSASLLPVLLPLTLRLSLDNAQGVILWYAQARTSTVYL